MKKILLADDDLKYSLLLKKFLQQNGYDVSYAGNGKMALDLFFKEKADVVLLDINMPELNGFEVAQEIRKKDQKVIMFFLTDRSEKHDRLTGFKLKANDYMSKPFYPEELLARIQERLGEDLSENKTYSFGNSSFFYGANEIITHKTKAIITSRQAEILRLLIEHINECVSRSELLCNVWGAESYTNSLALNVQISYLRHALISDDSIRIVTVIRKGYMLQEVK